MASPVSRHLSARSKVAWIIVMVLALAITTWLTPVHLVVLCAYLPADVTRTRLAVASAVARVGK